jgi:HEAT repeat protein
MAGPRRVGLDRFHVLGWQEFLDAGSVARLHVTSIDFREQTATHLLKALRHSVSMKVADEARMLKVMDALARHSSKGDVATIEVLAPLVGHGEPALRQAAIAALRCVAARGDECVMQYIEAELTSGANRKVTGLRALSMLAARGDPEAVSRVIQLLQDDDLVVRMAATDALRKLTSRGDAAAITQVGKLLLHDSVTHREAAHIALAHLAEAGDQHAIEVVRQGLDHERAQVRKDALPTLERLMTPLGNRRDGTTVAAIVKRLATDEHEGVRASAASLLGKVDPCDETVRTALFTSLLDEGASVRHAAILAIEQLAKATSTEKAAVVAVLTDASQDQDSGVRAAALQAVGRLAEDTDSEAASLILGCMGDDEARVRVAAGAAAGMLIGRGSSPMISAALSVLKGRDQNAREAASVALQKMPASLTWLLSPTSTRSIELPVSPLGRRPTLESPDSGLCIRRGHPKKLIA